MTIPALGRVSKMSALTLLCGSLAVWVGGAIAGPADAEMLRSYVGSYIGKGVTSGSASQPEAVRCRLILQPAGSDKVNYSGRCSISGANVAMAGIFAVVGDHVEADMSSNAGASATVVGQRRNGGIVFSSKAKNLSEGRDQTITSSLTLAKGTIQVEFSVLDNKTRKLTTGAVPFVRS